MGGRTRALLSPPKSPGVRDLAQLGSRSLKGKWRGIRVHQALSVEVEDKWPAAQNRGASLVSKSGPALEEVGDQTLSPERGKVMPRGVL